MAARKSFYRRLEKTFGSRRRARRVRCRCSACEHRQTFRGLPWTKTRIPACHCGSTQWRVDWYRQLTETTRTKCDCGGRSFPHRRGSCGMPKYLAAKAA